RANNPRTHSPKQIAQLVRSMQHFGFTNPVLVDDANGIIAGHGRVLAAKELGLTEVPTVRLSGMSEADIRCHLNTVARADSTIAIIPARQLSKVLRMKPEAFPIYPR